MMQNILVAYDLSECSNKALKLAVEMANRYKSKLTVMHVLVADSRLVAFGAMPDKESLEKTIHEKISQFLLGLSRAADTEKNTTIKIVWGDPEEALCAAAKELSADLLVLGTHGRTGLKHFFLGSVAEKTLRKSPVSTLVVRSDESWPPKRVLLPVDFVELVDDVLLYALELSKMAPMVFELVHVVSMPDLILTEPGVGAPVPPDILNSLESHAKKMLDEIASKHEFLKNSARYVVTGQPSDEIGKLAKAKGSDMILMPTHGHKNLEQFFFGSVAEGVVRYAPCNVLTFRE